MPRLRVIEGGLSSRAPRSSAGAGVGAAAAGLSLEAWAARRAGDWRSKARRARAAGRFEEAERAERMAQGIDELARRARAVCLSSVHRAKGLERDRVWMLMDTFRPGRSVEEDNLWYVAVTRAKRVLLRVEGVR